MLRCRSMLVLVWVFMTRPFGGLSISGFWLRLWPFNGWCFLALCFVYVLLRRRRSLVTGGRRWRGTRRRGMDWTQAASTTATTTASATG